MNPGQARRVAQNFYVTGGTVSGADVETTLSEGARLLKGWVANVVGEFTWDALGRVEFVANPSPSTTMEGTVIEGAANIGDLLEIPAGLTAVRSETGLLLGPGYVRLT